MNIFFTSDTHINHTNIIKGVSNWPDTSRCRDFKGREDHNHTIIDIINKYVMPDDILYHLGDWSFGGISSVWWFMEQLACQNIHLILGNHDHHILMNKVLPNHPSQVRAQEIFASVNQANYITIEKKLIYLNHYAARVWDASHKGSYHLYGHSHDTLPPSGRSMDVGIDVAYRMYGEYRPFSFEEIDNILSKASPVMVDHHNPNTT